MGDLLEHPSLKFNYIITNVESLKTLSAVLTGNMAIIICHLGGNLAAPR